MATARPSAAGPGGACTRVMLVTNEYPPEKTAGTAVSTRSLAEEVAGRGYHVSVVVTTRRRAPGYESDGTLEVIRLRPAPVPMTRMAQRCVALARLTRRLRPDVIQGQSLSCGALARLAAAGLGIPTVVYVQGLDLYQAAPWERRTYIRWALTRCDAIAAVTADLRERAHALSGRSAEVIPHGLRQRAAHGLERGAARVLLDLPAGARIVLYVGRLIRIKGVDHLIRALPLVVDAHPTVRLVVVGEGEERSRLTALTRALGVADRVHFTGERSPEDVIRFMRAADVFVLPSLVEAFGIVLVEAMSCGLPIVASNVMGIPLVVTDQVNALLVPPGDAPGLADRLASLLADPARAAAMGRVNVIAADEYALPRVADRFAALWDQVCVARARRAAPVVNEAERWTAS